MEKWKRRIKPCLQMIWSDIQKNQRILPKEKKKENLLELKNEFIKVVVVQLLSCIQIFVTP